jgi:hypothetical protein
LPAGVNAQNNTPTLVPGVWEGSMLFSGSYEISGQGFDDADYADQANVTASGTTFQLLVDDEGQIIEGKMEVDISWTVNATGTTPQTDKQYSIRHEHRLTDTLTMSGSASRIVASGTLTWDTQTYNTEGLVEEVSGPEPADVEWVFSVSQADCTTINGSLIEARGGTLVLTSTKPQVVFEDDYESFHDLLSVIWAWPETEDPEFIGEEVAAIETAAKEILAGVPTVGQLVQLVFDVEVLRAELAKLETCQLVPPGSIPEGVDSWLATIIQQALNKALDLGEFTPQELIAFLNIGVRSEALNNELQHRFEVALNQALFNAITDQDIDTIRDIAIAAAQYGYTELHLDAVAAAEELEGASP